VTFIEYLARRKTMEPVTLTHSLVLARRADIARAVDRAHLADVTPRTARPSALALAGRARALLSHAGRLAAGSTVSTPSADPCCA